jgi:two-component system, OmpR family, response regulator
VTYNEVGTQDPQVSPLGEQSTVAPRRDNAEFVDNGHILVVDDQQEICDLVHDYLTEEGFRVSIAHNGAGLCNELARSKIDLVILDLVLGGEDGLQLARELRDGRPEIGILMLTGRGETLDRIIGLEMGADDYLSKPFHLRELLARARSVLRRATSRRAEKRITSREAEKSDAHRRARFADWVLDLLSRELLSPSGENVRLTTGEFELLAVLVNHTNHVLSRDRLLDLSRHREAGPFDRTIDVQIGRLRRKLEDDPKNPKIIKTVRGGGYIFIPTVDFE